ncbi:MAG: archaetidylserine decarboxylase [Chromatiales bacterium]|nr:archaetidylserine decarboxylase [Chromatiales bacterium]
MSEPNTTSDRLKSLLLYPLPHHAISRIVHRLARLDTRLKDPLLRAFIRHFGVDMSEAEQEDPAAYPSFNAFFTRTLKPGMRPIADEPDAVACPADGRVSQAGRIENGRIFQAKGHDYSVVELLGGDAARAAPFMGGRFATIYLSPRDYHRVHMPLAGRLREMVHVPGRLFSVAPHTVRNVPRLFARNERVAAIFDSEAGPMAVVLVGAINVASIETVWCGEVTPPTRHEVDVSLYQTGDVALARGAEMGRFNLGSTVILLFGDGDVEWEPSLRPGESVRMGQRIGRQASICKAEEIG